MCFFRILNRLRVQLVVQRVRLQQALARSCPLKKCCKKSSRISPRPPISIFWPKELQKWKTHFPISPPKWMALLSNSIKSDRNKRLKNMINSRPNLPEAKNAPKNDFFFERFPCFICAHFKSLFAFKFMTKLLFKLQSFQSFDKFQFFKVSSSPLLDRSIPMSYTYVPLCFKFHSVYFNHLQHRFLIGKYFKSCL